MSTLKDFIFEDVVDCIGGRVDLFLEVNSKLALGKATADSIFTAVNHVSLLHCSKPAYIYPHFGKFFEPLMHK